MTTPSPAPSAHFRRGDPARAGTSNGQPSTTPVIVLAPPYTGAGTLRSLLEGYPDLACTAGTGLLPLCEQAVATWRRADGRLTAAPSPLALTATRTLASSVIMSILAATGKRRWCEVAIPNPQVGETFLRLYPGTQFICLYRSCPAVIRAVLDSSRWGVTDPLFATFTSAYPASTVAALAAYWVTVTGPLLDFEREYPQSCLRVRYEDLTRNTQAEERISSYLGLGDIVGPRIPENHSEPRISSPGPEISADFPVNLIPPNLLAQANDLLQQLNYPLMAADQSKPSPGLTRANQA